MKRFLHSDNGFVEQDEWRPDCWVNIEVPDEDDTRYLSEQFGVPDSFMESLADPDERPRFDSESGWSLTILRVPMPQSDGHVPYTTVPIGIMTNRDMIISVCYWKTEMIDDFIAFSQKRQITIKRQSDFILRLMFSSTYWFLQYLKDINTQVVEAEGELRKSVQNRDLLKLMKLQKTLVFFNTSIHGNEALLERIGKVYNEDYDVDLLEDLEIEMKQADNTVGVYSDILSSTMDAYASIISNNVNAIMKRMTSLSLVLMVPTLIASLYGMNVEGLWFANLRWSFVIVLAIAIALTAITYAWLRRKDWF